MYKKLSLLVLFVLLCTNTIASQSIDHLKEINTVWVKFYKAFDSLDHTLMAEIHSKDLIRISGGSRILDYTAYIDGYKATFKNAREHRIRNRIALRFFERINTDSIASERGIYKLTRTESSGKEQTYYGQFHVLFKKKNNEWKILMDYDSNEGNTIGEKEFLKAHGIEQFEPFVKN